MTVFNEIDDQCHRTGNQPPLDSGTAAFLHMSSPCNYLKTESCITTDSETESNDSSESESFENRSAVYRRQLFSQASIFDVKVVQNLFKQHSIKFEHAYKLWQCIVQRKVDNVREVEGLPKKAYELLELHCKLPTSKVASQQTSADGSTTKLLIELQDGKKIESVIMRYGKVELQSKSTEKKRHNSNTLSLVSSQTAFRSAPRSVVCVSSQVGCAMGCRFCATGTMGLLANLTSGEILEQLYHASRIEPIRNVVFMGMGEPLDNYNEVIDAIKLMTDVRVFNVASHRVSLSTVGVVPRLKQLKLDVPNVSLALSLHAPTQAIRERIVPTAKSWNVDAILSAAVEFVKSQKSRSQRMMKNQDILIEYVLLSGINSSESIAQQLVDLLKPHESLILLNIIPYNPTVSSPDMIVPTQTEIDTFLSVIRQGGLRVLLRQTLGQDISSACGQLVIQQTTVDRGCKTTTVDVEDVVKKQKSFYNNQSPPPVESKPEVREASGFYRRLHEVSTRDLTLTFALFGGVAYAALRCFR